MIIPKVRYIVFRYNHHSPHSGYSRTAEYGIKTFNAEKIVVSKPLPRSIIRNRVLKRLAEGTPGYDRAAMAAELKVGWQIIRDHGYIYHFLYGETTYHYTGYLNNVKNNRLVATFHQPPIGLRKAVNIDWHLRKLSAVICVGRNQREFFKDVVDDNRLFFVPLGVDTEFFTPPPSRNKRDLNLCVFVGENYRDFPTLRGVIELVSYHRPNTKFIGVTLPQAFPLIGSHPNLRLYSGINEADLLELYRSASLMVMPLIDATANNAVLESMACGLPLVVSDVGSIQDYVSPEGTAMIPVNDSISMAETILNLLDNPLARERMSDQSREQAIKFSWPNTMNRLRSVYETIA